MGYYRRILLAAGLLMLVVQTSAQKPEPREENLPSVFERFEKPQGLYAKTTCHIEQPASLRVAVDELHARNHHKPGMKGYRVRIYRSIGRDARRGSQAAMDTVLHHFKGLPTYRSYTSPYYKVAVGDCRTRYEALALQKRLLHIFPQAFVVSGPINLPPLEGYTEKE